MSMYEVLYEFIYLFTGSINVILIKAMIRILHCTFCIISLPPVNFKNVLWSNFMTVFIIFLIIFLY